MVAYADDIVIGHNITDISSNRVIEEVKTLFANYGLTVQERKCATTQYGNSITFMGQSFDSSNPLSLAPKVLQKIEECIEVLRKTPATVQ